MPLRLTALERQVFLHRDWGPGPILDMFGALSFKVIHAACKMGLFEQLQAAGPVTVVALAERLGADPKGLGLVMDSLVGLGYLTVRRGARYGNSRMTSRWMVRKGDGELAPAFSYFDDSAQRWSDLDRVVLGRKASPSQDALDWFEGHDRAWERYHEGVRGIATIMAGPIISGIRLPRHARRVIDVGGSHGLYSARLCQRHPGLTADVFDREHARSTAEKTIRDSGMEGRVRFVAGDILNDTLSGTYDAVLLLNTIRVFREAEAKTVVRKSFAALSPGGMVFVADQFPTAKGTAFSRLNANLILLELYNGGAAPYSVTQVREMLRAAGFVDTRFVRLARTPGSHIVSGVKH